MDRIIIKTIELIHIGEAAKALKQKEFQIFNQFIIGIDDSVTMKYVQLDSNIFRNDYRFDNFIINTRELSAFINSITLESEFLLEYHEDSGYTINTIKSTLWFRKSFTTNICCASNIDTFYKVQNMMQYPPCQPEIEISNNISQLFLMKKGDGSILYNHLNRYMITLFSGLLPLNKSDKVYLSIYHNSNYAFNALFRIKKKKFNVIICIAYLYI